MMVWNSWMPAVGLNKGISLEKLRSKSTEVFLVSELADSKLMEQNLLFSDMRKPKML